MPYFFPASEGPQPIVTRGQILGGATGDPKIDNQPTDTVFCPLSLEFRTLARDMAVERLMKTPEYQPVKYEEANLKVLHKKWWTEVEWSNFTSDWKEQTKIIVECELRGVYPKLFPTARVLTPIFHPNVGPGNYMHPKIFGPVYRAIYGPHYVNTKVENTITGYRGDAVVNWEADQLYRFHRGKFAEKIRAVFQEYENKIGKDPSLQMKPVTKDDIVKVNGDTRYAVREYYVWKDRKIITL